MQSGTSGHLPSDLKGPQGDMHASRDQWSLAVGLKGTAGGHATRDWWSLAIRLKGIAIGPYNDNRCPTVMKVRLS